MRFHDQVTSFAPRLGITSMKRVSIAVMAVAVLALGVDSWAMRRQIGYLDLVRERPFIAVCEIVKIERSIGVDEDTGRKVEVAWLTVRILDVLKGSLHAPAVSQLRMEENGAVAEGPVIPSLAPAVYIGFAHCATLIDSNESLRFMPDPLLEDGARVIGLLRELIRAEMVPDTQTRSRELKAVGFKYWMDRTVAMSHAARWLLLEYAEAVGAARDFYSFTASEYSVIESVLSRSDDVELLSVSIRILRAAGVARSRAQVLDCMARIRSAAATHQGWEDPYCSGLSYLSSICAPEALELVRAAIVDDVPERDLLYRYGVMILDEMTHPRAGDIALMRVRQPSFGQLHGDSDLPGILAKHHVRAAAHPLWDALVNERLPRVCLIGPYLMLADQPDLAALAGLFPEPDERDMWAMLSGGQGGRAYVENLARHHANSAVRSTALSLLERTPR